MKDARMSAQWWHDLLQRTGAGQPVPLITGGDDPPKPDDNPRPGDEPPETGTVSKKEFDRIKTLADRRDGLLRKAQKDLADFREIMQQIFDALGIELPEDPEERKARLEELKAEREKQRAGTGKTLAKEEHDRILAEREKKHQKDLAAERGTSERLRRRLRDVLIDREAISAAAELGATEGGIEAIRMKIATEADLQEGDGDDEPRAIIKGKDGPRLSDKTSEPMTIRERVEEIARDEKYGSWFKAAGRPGAGSQSNPPGRPPGGVLRVTRANLGDAEWYSANRDKILAAQREGTLIVE